MKKTLLLLLGGLACLLLFLLVTPQFAAKRAALGSVGKTLLTAPHHQGIVIEGGTKVMKARYNLPVIARATEYCGTFGSGTGVFREISRIAAEADRECERLEDVLDLAVRSTSEAGRILNLAETACRVEGTEYEAAWQAAYDELVAMAAYSSVEDAVRSLSE